MDLVRGGSGESHMATEEVDVRENKKKKFAEDWVRGTNSLNAPREESRLGKRAAGEGGGVEKSGKRLEEAGDYHDGAK